MVYLGFLVLYLVSLCFFPIFIFWYTGNDKWKTSIWRREMITGCRAEKGRRVFPFIV